jgi:hypothetical protein
VRLHKNAKIELLKGVPLFGRCSKKELAEIATIADEIDLPEGKQLTKEGAAAASSSSCSRARPTSAGRSAGSRPSAPATSSARSRS